MFPASMPPASKHLLIPLAVVAILLTGCGLFRDPPPSKYESTPVFAQDTTLGARDVFLVRVFKHDDMSGEYAVSEEGTINFPEIGIVKVVGRTPAQVEQEIQTRLADGYLVNPTVSVLVKEYKSKTVSVLGQVRKPSVVNYVSGLSIVDAISQAGGFTPMARKNAVKVTRKGVAEAKTESYTVPVESIANGKASDFYLRPGDTVFVPERWY